MKTVITKALFISLALLNFSTQAIAEEVEQHVTFNSRPLSVEKTNVFKENKLQAAIQESPEISLEAQELLSQIFSLKVPLEAFSGEETLFLDKTLAGTRIPIKSLLRVETEDVNDSLTAVNSPYIYHWVKGFPQPGIIQTEDGSEWAFDHPETTYNWSLGDAIVITPKYYSVLENTLYYLGVNNAKYSYTLLNKDHLSSLDVTPFIGPVKQGVFTVSIQGIDYPKRRVYTLNGKNERLVWEVVGADAKLFEDWKVGDALILGSDNSWLGWFSSFDHILINVEMNHYVRAKPILAPDPMKQPRYYQAG